MFEKLFEFGRSLESRYNFTLGPYELKWFGWEIATLGPWEFNVTGPALAVLLRLQAPIESIAGTLDVLSKTVATLSDRIMAVSDELTSVIGSIEATVAAAISNLRDEIITSVDTRLADALLSIQTQLDILSSRAVATVAPVIEVISDIPDTLRQLANAPMAWFESSILEPIFARIIWGLDIATHEIDGDTSVEEIE